MSKKILPLGQKSITNWNGRYPRAMETELFVFFVKLDEGDENAQAIMYHKRDNHLQLVSDNYLASVGLFDALKDGEETWMSPAMKKAREYEIKEVILPLVKEYIELSHKGNTSCFSEDGKRFLELESEIEDSYVTLPEHDVCMFLEGKFAEYL